MTKIQTWNNTIDQVTKEVKEHFGKLSSDQLNWKPNKKTWSIAQNLDHLIIINESYYPTLKAVGEGKFKIPFTGKIGPIVRFLGSTLLKSVQPDRKRKMKTLTIWEPTVDTIQSDIVGRFEQHQNELKQKMEGCSHLIDKGVVISSPGNKYLVYTLEKAFDIITSHELRHVNQAKEVLEFQIQK
jgi:hypothetical protein